MTGRMKPLGDVMFRMSLSYFVRIGEAIQPLREISQTTTNSEAFMHVSVALSTINELLSNAIVNRDLIRASVIPAQELQSTLANFTEQIDWNESATEAIGVLPYLKISNALNHFYSVFSSELGTANAYLVTNKGAYDPVKLISSGESLFPIDLLSKVPNASYDAKEIGRCLAFELATACGFHTTRLLESVIRAYWDVVAKGEDRPKNPNLGVYIREFEKLEFAGKREVISTLQIIKDVHRNPLIHPENNLSVTQAISFIAIANSAISYMLEHIEPDTTNLDLLDSAEPSQVLL